MFKALNRIAAALEDIALQMKETRAEQREQAAAMKEQASKAQAPLGEMFDLVRKLTGGKPL